MCVGVTAVASEESFPSPIALAVVSLFMHQRVRKHLADGDGVVFGFLVALKFGVDNTVSQC